MGKEKALKGAAFIIYLYHAICSIQHFCLSVLCVEQQQRREMEREDQNQSAYLQSPLLQHSHSSGHDDGLVVNEKQSSWRRIERRDVVEEVKKQLWLAGPLITVTLLNYCLNVISVMFVGHLGELALSGASMATSFASVTGFSLLVCYFCFPSYHVIN